MAELPHIGKHCDVAMCNRLDFLPVKCDSCKGSFCVEHFTYDQHECTEAYQKNVQVPVCPMCNQPVPTPKGVSPDQQVNDHIQKNCEVQKKRIFNYRCTSKGCKRKELIPVTCSSCQQNFCLQHRHEKDHGCTGRSGLSKAAAAAIARDEAAKKAAAKQMAADEKLARQLNSQHQMSTEEMDRRLAEQMQNEFNGDGPRRQANGGNCNLQ